MPTVISVSLGATSLENGTDYTVVYKDNRNIGTASVIVAGKGNYTGNVTKNFNIHAKKGIIITIGAYRYKIKGQKKPHLQD